MSGERYYTTKIWPQPSSTGSSNEDASFISTDPRGEPVTSTWKKSCREVETVPEFPELTCQNFRNPHLEAKLDAPTIAFSVFQGALHFFVQNFHKASSSNAFRASCDQIRRAIATGKDTHDRLFHPIGFQIQAKGVAQHHRGAQNRPNRICRVPARQGRC